MVWVNVISRVSELFKSNGRSRSRERPLLAALPLALKVQIVPADAPAATSLNVNPQAARILRAGSSDS
jgi:hypothetical protein